MKNTIYLLSSMLQWRIIHINSKILPKKPQSETVDIKLLGYKKPTAYLTIQRFEKQENMERKIGCGQKCALSSSITSALLKKQT
jgi:hypothetical protein